MNGIQAGIYTGTVRHRRFQPRRHEFSYQIYMVLLDLQQLPGLASASRLFSLERFNWLTYRDRDYLSHRSEPNLLDRLQADAAAAGHAWPGGRVFLLTHLRVLGFCFNPVSYYYCCAEDGEIALLCAEVTNTPWKERVTYWMDPAAGKPGPEGTAWGFEVEKRMHVSPFNPMGLRYRWAFSKPEESLVVRMALLFCSDFFMDVDLRLVRNCWSSDALRQSLFAFPVITIKVLAAIHWEALRLWIKRVPVYTHPGTSRIAEP